MTALTRKEKEKILNHIKRPVERGVTWIGLRPTIMKDKKKDAKQQVLYHTTFYMLARTIKIQPLCKYLCS